MLRLPPESVLSQAHATGMQHSHGRLKALLAYSTPGLPITAAEAISAASEARATALVCIVHSKVTFAAFSLGVLDGIQQGHCSGLEQAAGESSQSSTSLLGGNGPCGFSHSISQLE